MESILNQVISRISSYNIFNNLFPGILFCYFLRILFGTNILVDNWIVNLIVVYFVGIVISRIGSIIIEPIMKKIHIGKKPLMLFVKYSDYTKASNKDPLLVTLSEVNNMYRTLLSLFVCIFMYKISILINTFFVKSQHYFFQNNKEWFILIGFMILFACSYKKQTEYIGNRVTSIINNKED